MLQRGGTDRAASGLRTQLGRVHVAEITFRRVPAGHSAVHHRDNRRGRCHALPDRTAVDMGTIARVNTYAHNVPKNLKMYKRGAPVIIIIIITHSLLLLLLVVVSLSVDLCTYAFYHFSRKTTLA